MSSSSSAVEVGSNGTAPLCLDIDIDIDKVGKVDGQKTRMNIFAS